MGSQLSSVEVLMLPLQLDDRGCLLLLLWLSALFEELVGKALLDREAEVRIEHENLVKKVYCLLSSPWVDSR